MRSVAAALLLFAAPTAAPPVVAGLDHMPIAVRDLAAAGTEFQALGFVLKPGRLHANSILNLHAKFPNHGELELITASRPDDALARDYLGFLRVGEGGAWWAAYAPDNVALAAALARAGVARDGAPTRLAADKLRHRLFFGARAPSPTDTPQLYAHPNTSYRFARVWIVGNPAERALIVTLGGTPRTALRCAPFGRTRAVVSFAEGDEAVYLPPQADVPSERAIAGATVLVRDLAAARRVFVQNGVGWRPDACERGAVWVNARGLWLQFLQRQALNPPTPAPYPDTPRGFRPSRGGP